MFLAIESIVLSALQSKSLEYQHLQSETKKRQKEGAAGWLRPLLIFSRIQPFSLKKEFAPSSPPLQIPSICLLSILFLYSR